MNLRKKKSVFVWTAMVVTILLYSLVSLMSFRYYGLNQVRSQSRTAAEMMRVALTEEMEKGLIGERADLIARMKRVPGLQDIHVVRGQPVIKQFGPGHASEKPTTKLELAVLKSGRSEEDLSDMDNDLYKVTIPFIASRFNDINCMNCHEVPEGTVNGAVTLTFSLEREHNAALLAMMPIILLVVFFGLVMAYFLTRLLNPVVNTANEVKMVLGRAKEGDFAGRVIVRSDDEVGEMAINTNQFVEALENSIGAISKKIIAIGMSDVRAGKQQQDLLSQTMHIVDDMVNATRFKQEIEEDLDLLEVYQRMRRILHDHFKLDRFCLYEIEPESGKLHKIFAEGMAEDRELWCDPVIMVDSDHCRAKRTAHSLCSCQTPNICAAYRPEREDDCHLCIPLMLSDRIGNVLQVICDPEQGRRIPELQSAIEAHMAVASPVVESKRLMQSLKESTLRDPMTGLYNRRFLENFTGHLTASTERRHSTLGILMLDVDFFKKVNDEHGHDVGDQVLKSLSEVIVQELRESDIVVRYGGEEFIALLPDADEKNMLLAAERIRASMESTAVQTAHGPLKKTISIGASLFPSDASGFWQCIKFSDVAMYVAKEGGRNQVRRFEKEMWKEDSQEY